MEPIQVGTKFVVEKGSTKLGITKGNRGTVTEVTPLGPEYNNEVRVTLAFEFPTYVGSKATYTRVLYAKHSNRLADTYPALHGMVAGQKILIRRRWGSS